ncbi:MAG: hypothetical protein HY011_33805 [Acidobacteria bacterium]|nr:hypothetical protein [Acidobacteriota bacterium]
MSRNNKTTATPSASGKRACRFEFQSSKAKAVCIAGSFNDWQPGATPMVALGDGRWVKELTLPPGRYEYRLVVDGDWVDDPNAKETVANPHGGANAVLTVG